MLLSAEGAFHVSIHCYNSAWSGHLEFEIGVVRDCIEAGESCSSEQCMIATAEGDDVEDQLSLQKLSGDPKTTSSVIEPVQQASTPGMMPLKVVFVGLILEGSMPILRTVS